jgi:hypothetical protein
MSSRSLAAVAIAGILLVSFLVALAVPTTGHTLPSRIHGTGPAVAGAPIAARLPSVPSPGAVDSPPAAHALLAPLGHVHPLISLYTTILPDGTVSGGTALITTSGNTYTLTASFAGAIIDERNGSTFKGGGNTIAATGLAFGFQVNTSVNVSVTDLIITGESIGVEVVNSTNVTVTDTTAGAATSYGFLVGDSAAVTLRNDYSNASQGGFGAQISSGITIDDSIADTAAASAFSLLLVTGATLDGDQGTHATDFGIVAEIASEVDAVGDTLSFAGEVGLYCVVCTFSSFDEITSESSGVGMVFSTGSYNSVYESNFSFATHYGAEIADVTDFILETTQFFQAGNTGLIVTYGGYDVFSHLQANSSGVTGIDIWNVTSASLTDVFANDNGWNGLSIERSSGVDATNVTASLTTASGGNGTFVEGSSNSMLKNGVDQHETIGILDLGSQGFEVLDSNASYDTNAGFDLGPDEAVSAISDTAFSDGLGFVLLEASGFYLYGDTATEDPTGFEELAGAGGSVYISSALHCAVGFLVEEDTNSFYYADATNATIDGFETVESTGTVLDGLAISGAAGPSGLGIELEATLDVPIELCNVSYSAYGFVLIEATDSDVHLNTFYHDTYDFEVVANGLHGAVVWWNNFIDGGGWKFIPTGGTANRIAFDAGYPTGGNYWSNWTSPDLESGPGQNLPGSDGIVDHPLPISGAYEDQYPLAEPFNFANLTVAFVETGLPSGTMWGVQFDVDEGGNSTSSTVDGYVPAAAYGTYDYSIYAPAGWVPSPSHGTVTTNGKLQSVAIAFTEATYTTTFTESGLAPGTHWNVTVGSTSYSGTGPTITVALGNGTYSYTVLPIAGYVVAPASGSVTVDASQPSVAIAFTAVHYAVTFTESGLSSGTAWSVTFGGLTSTSSTSTITFYVSNGSYAYSVGGVSGYSMVPGSGTQLVTGPGAGVTVAFTSNASMAPGGIVLFYALLGLVVLLAILVVVLLLRGRKKATLAPAGWTPPAGTTAPATGGGAAPGGPPAGVVAPPPPPDWKES